MLLKLVERHMFNISWDHWMMEFNFGAISYDGNFCTKWYERHENM
jgi:hypothetical protein